MYLFVFLILRLTGKRQVADLQPFDLLITLLIADLAGSCIADTDAPLVYSIVPILGMYFVQQLVTFLCLKNARARRIVCGSPILLVYDGVVQETAMRECDYTMIDLLDSLRAKDVFDLDEVAFAVLETNGTVNVLLKDDALPVTRGDARRTMQLKRETPALGWMLVLDGELCHDAIRRLGLTGEQVERTVKDLADCRLREVFYLHRSPGGGLQLQKKRFAGGERFVREAQNE